MTDAGGGLSDRLCRALPALREATFRTAYLRSELLRVTPEEAARALDAVAGRAEQADPVAREVMTALVPILSDPALEAWVEELRACGVAEALLSLSRLLRRHRKSAAGGPPSSRAGSAPAPEERGVALEPGGRPLSLGERRALARRPSRAVLNKLLSDPHPMVIRNVLGNPRLTEDDVVRMAAHRPGRPEVLVEIARSPVWSTRARVRMAVVMNPGTPPEICAAMLPLLVRAELAQVASAPSVPKVVRSGALDLLERRPPAPDRGDGSGTVQ